MNFPSLTIPLSAQFPATPVYLATASMATTVPAAADSTTGVSTKPNVPKRQRYTGAYQYTVTRLIILVIALLAAPSFSYAFEKLTEAQSLVYDTPHLENTSNGQTLTYQYEADSKDKEPVSDRVLLSVENANADGRRDVTLDFLTEERRLALPDFTGYRGNPIIIAMLEHIAQKMGGETGGGVIYFRNRIRDALAAETVTIAQSEMEFGEARVATTEVNFSPFKNDPYVAEMPEYSHSIFTISLSDEVPGGVLSIVVESKQDDTTYFQRRLKLDAS